MNTFERIVELVAQLPSGTRGWFSKGPERATPENLQRYAQRAWPTWPFGERGGDVCGLRILPGKPLSAWPMARGRRSCGRTFGSSARFGLPMMFYERVIALFPNQEHAERSRGGWKERRQALEPLQLLLGGQPEDLDAYEALLFSDAVPLAGSEYSQERRDVDNVHLRLLDSSPEHIRFRDFLHERLREGATWLPVPRELGVWQNAALCVAFAKDVPLFGDDPCPTHAVPWAWELTHLAPQFDLGMMGGHKTHALSDTGMAHHLNVARALVAIGNDATDAQREAWAEDPIWTVVVPAAASGAEEWYLAYMEAAAAFDALEQPEYSWNALCAGAMWVAKQGGPWRPFFDAALALARRRGWTDVQLALENMAERAQLD